MDFSIRPLHCGISVSSMEDAARWFKEILGFCEVFRDELPEAGFRLAFLRNGEFEIELFECYEYQPMPEGRKLPNEDVKTLGTKHICFAVDDLDGFAEHCRKHSVKLVMGPVHLLGNYACFIHGPEDILIEFIERKRQQEEEDGTKKRAVDEKHGIGRL